MTTAVPRELTRFIAQSLSVDARLVTPQARFADLGRTSFAELELLSLIEDHYCIILDFKTYLDQETVGALAEAIAAAAQDNQVQAAAD